MTGNPLKITFSVHRYPPAVSGSEVYCAEIAKRLALSGNAVSVVTSDLYDWEGTGRYRPLREQRDGVSVVRLPYLLPLESVGLRLLQKSSSLTPWRALVRDPVGWKTIAPLLLTQPDVIHATPLTRSCTDAAILAGRIGAVPVVVTPFYHFADPNFVSLASHSLRYLRQCAHILTCTDAETATLRHHGISHVAMTRVGCGVDTSFIHQTPPGNWRTRLQIPESSFVALFLSATFTHPSKGGRDFARASRLLPQNQFVFAGGSESEWQQVRREFSLEGNCHYAGFVEGRAKIQLLKSVDAVAIPSISDAFGIAYFEALACGKPVVTANIPSMTELYSDVGINVPHGSAEAVAAAIEKLRTDADLYARLSRRALQKAQLYDWQTIADQVEQVYREVLCGEGAGKNR